MRFRLNFSNTIEYVEVVFPPAASVSLPANAILQCGFGNHLASTCTMTGNTVRINKPKEIVLTTSNYYEVFITTKCGASPGITFGAAGFFTATINFSNSGIATTETSNLDFTIYPSS